MPMNGTIIQETAKSLYEDLKNEHSESFEIKTFSASKGWFERFKRYHSLHDIYILK